MKAFPHLKYKVFPQEKLKNFKGLIRNRDLSLATSVEIKTALEKQWFTDYKRITISEVKKYKHTYILTFYKSVIPKEVKIGYCLKRVEQNI